MKARQSESGYVVKETANGRFVVIDRHGRAVAKRPTRELAEVVKRAYERGIRGKDWRR